MTHSTPIKLRIPNQDMAQFSRFELRAEAAENWAQGLAITNTRLVAQQLREAISELNRVVVAPDVRFDILEALWPKLQIVLEALSKKFLNQPLTLPEEPRQMSELASILYSLGTTAYTLVAIHTIRQKELIEGANPAQLVCEALHRAVGLAGRKMLQAYQLYQPVEPHAWLELHQLYSLAERQQLANLPVSDGQFGESTLTEAYLRVLILSCCKPNQLRQGDLTAIFQGLYSWREFIQLEDPESGRGLFQVDLGDDQAPMYSALCVDSVMPNSRFIDASALVARLQSLKEEDDRLGKPGISFDKNTRLASNILEHLINSLGTMSKRNFARASADSRLSITLGLSNAHYFISGGLTFDQLLHGANNDEREKPASNPFMLPSKHHDAWELANPHEEHLDEDIQYSGEEVIVDDSTLAQLEERQVRRTAKERHRAYPVEVIDASPGGYCLEWTHELPTDVKTGDIVCVRDGDTAEWVVAVTRWVSQLRNSRTLVGIELLSPTAMPYGARIVHTTGEEADLMRVLLLPEIKLVGQPHTLITPRTGFRERQKVSLVREGEQFYLQLLRQVAATGSFAQFDFRYIKLLEDVIAEDKSGPLTAAYDSLWTNI
jgi:cyclic-di-GMP-binding protein